MPAYFLDTSAFAKLYHQEAGSEYVVRLVEQPGSSTVVSRLAVLEIESVFATKFRTGELDAFGQEACRRSLRADLSQWRIQVGPRIEEHHYSGTRKLLIQYGSKMALRTLDSLQLAIALDLKKAGIVSVMVVADQRLCQVAEMCSFATISPSASGIVVL